ncbi:MAG TPA: cytochrome c [Tepidisphaeraceae bacterium]|nr:cytochrome c [Tepidisphaeraceae bacterium]
MSKETPGNEEASAQERNSDQAWCLLLFLAVAIGIGSVAFIIQLPSWKPVNNMEWQPYFKPYRRDTFFADGMSERPLMSGVVPRPMADSPGMPYVYVRSPGPAEFPEVATTSSIPFPITRAVLERGQELFDINCSVCHSIAGDGDGMVVERGFYSPPSYYIPRLMNEPDSYFYDVITNGYGVMFSYNDRVAPNDRWAIVAYIRALQLAVREHPELDKQLQKERGVRP